MANTSGAAADVLLVGDPKASSVDLSECLRARGYRVEVSERGLPASFDGNPPDLIVLCPPIFARTADDVLGEVRARDGGTPVVVAGHRDHVRAERLMAAGAFECVLDPADEPHRLLAAVGYALGSREEDRALSYLRERDATGARLIGEHPSMRRIFEMVAQVCQRTAAGATPAILVCGETGTGKGALAKTLHYRSLRRHRPFVEVNCAALPANLVESELYGYEKGAFTDAGRSRPGLFETANRGTLFLDEIPSVPLGTQAKLLTSIEEKACRRIGGRELTRLDVQIIAAAQPVLRSLVKSGDFREDLYHRLNVIRIELPPLRERGEDAILLARAFVEELSREYGIPPRHLSADAEEFIHGYHWPGNVRELRNQIERIVLLSEDEAIEGWQFERVSGELVQLSVDDEEGEPELRIRMPASGLPLVEVEKRLIRRALEMNDGNVTRTARYLSITRQTLIYRMRKFGLSRQ